MRQFRRAMTSGKKAVGAIMSLFNARNFLLEYDRVLHETLLVLVLRMAVRQ